MVITQKSIFLLLNISTISKTKNNNYLINICYLCCRKDRKMALIQLPSMDEAVVALIKMHNYQLSESNHLRVSFSKSSI